jgi:hypothetical protein
MPPASLTIPFCFRENQICVASRGSSCNQRIDRAAKISRKYQVPTCHRRQLFASLPPSSSPCGSPARQHRGAVPRPHLRVRRRSLAVTPAMVDRWLDDVQLRALPLPLAVSPHARGGVSLRRWGRVTIGTGGGAQRVPFGVRRDRARRRPGEEETPKCIWLWSTESILSCVLLWSAPVPRHLLKFGQGGIDGAFDHEFLLRSFCFFFLEHASQLPIEWIKESVTDEDPELVFFLQEVTA